MAYVPGYKHDVFLSYAHIDNEPLGGEKGWVTTLAEDLKKYLHMGIGCRDPDIWMDHGLTGNEPFPKKIEEALRDCATLLVIASPGYLKSEWCARERNAFLKEIRAKSAAGSRIFRVDLSKLDRNDFPSEFRDLLGYPFWMPDTNGNPRTLDFPVVEPREQKYIDILNKLRLELGEELGRLRSLRFDHVTPAPSAPAVFLAEVTDDLEDLREELVAYIKQAGLVVLPDISYPDDDSEMFRQHMEADLGQSKLFVQLLSHVRGKKFAGEPSRLPIFQYEQAKKARQPIIQWRSRELDLEKIKANHPEHYNLLIGSEVRACGIEEFKRAVVEAARKEGDSEEAHQKKCTKLAPIYVFVNSDPSDSALAKELCGILQEERIGHAVPVRLIDEHAKPADVREDLEVNLANCSGLIVVHGNTPVSWVRRQLAEGRKILSQREEPLAALAIVQGPHHEKEDIGLWLPAMQSIDCCHGVHRDLLRKFIVELRN